MPLNPAVQRSLRSVAGGQMAQPQNSLSEAMSKAAAKASAVAMPWGDSVSVGGGGGGGGSSAVYTGKTDTDKIMHTIRQRESGGNYTAKNPVSSASGAYQFIDSTWGGYGGYKHAWQAPKAVQDAKARQHISGILGRYGGQLEAVPAAWYTGSYRGKGKLNYHPGGPGNPLTVQQYVNKWMADFNRY